MLSINDILNLVLGFLALGLLASGTYIFNDLLDIQDDRLHFTKKTRPFASGQLSIPHGIILMGLCLTISAGITLFLPKSAGLVLLTYLIVTLVYSIILKKLPIVDVLILASLFTIRVISGAAIVRQFASPWLVSFIITFFLSLALAKRYTELVKLTKIGKRNMPGRGYNAEDSSLILSFGMMATALAMMSYILYALIANAPVLKSDTAVMLIGIILIYWIMRMWLLAHRGQLNDDPVLFAVKDPVSIGLGGLIGIIVLLEQVGLKWLDLI